MRLLLLLGPPAVGKMTVGTAVAAASAYRLFHNHASIEPLLEVFDYGSPPFSRLLDEFRRRVIDEAAGAGVDLILTLVWDLESEVETATVESYLAPYADRGAEIHIVELAADLATRLARNRTKFRLAEKRSKRDVGWSDGNVRDAERLAVSTRPGRRTVGHRVLERHRFLRLDNTDVPADEAARRILAWVASTG